LKGVVMAESNAEILRAGYEAFARGDVPAVLALFSEEIAWTVPGRNPLSGEYKGHDGVGGFFQALGERSNGTFHLEVHDLLDNGEETVVVLVTENAERNGAQLSAPSVHVWRMQDGQATNFKAFQHDDYETDEFWA
jgi:ketosteroid isomerase-like protein